MSSFRQILDMRMRCHGSQGLSKHMPWDSYFPIVDCSHQPTSIKDSLRCSACLCLVIFFDAVSGIYRAIFGCGSCKISAICTTLNKSARSLIVPINLPTSSESFGAQQPTHCQWSLHRLLTTDHPSKSEIERAVPDTRRCAGSLVRR